MAYDLSTLRPTGAARWAVRRLSLPATAGNVLAVTLPAGAVSVTVTTLDSAGAAAAGYVATDGQTDGAAVDAASAWPLASGDALPVALAGDKVAGRAVLYVAGVASGYAVLAVEV